MIYHTSVYHAAVFQCTTFLMVSDLMDIMMLPHPTKPPWRILPQRGINMSDNITYLFEENSFTDLTLYQFGREHCAPMLSCGPAKHNHYLLHYVLSGKGTFSSMGESFNVGTGQAFLIFPDNVTLYVADRADPWTYLWIEFDGLKVEHFLTDAGFSLKNPIYTSAAPSGTEELRDLLLSLLDNHENSLRLIGTMYLILETLIRTSSVYRPPRSRNLQEFYVHEASMYIDRHYDEEITVNQLADWCGIDRSYFGKIFRDTILMNPQKYLIRYRMNIACGLLRDTSMPISQVASEVGYGNQMNFSRVFRKEMGLSPSEWKKRACLETRRLS